MRMVRTWRRVTATLGILAIAGIPAALPVAAGGNDTWLYPGPDCPKASEGLQACAEGAQSGDTILLTAEIIDESVDITKSLTLRPSSSGLDPILDFVSIRDTDGTSHIEVSISGIRVRYGIQGYTYESAGGEDRITIRDVEVGKGVSSANLRGIIVEAPAPVVLTVTGSYIRSTDSQGATLQLYATHANGSSRLRAVGNTVTQHDSGDAGGAGIQASMSQGGTMEVQLYNNRIWDVAGDNAGAAAGISLYPRDASTLHADIVGNSIDQVGTFGVYLRNDVSPPGRVTVDLFDDVIAHTAAQAVALHSEHASTLTRRAGNNAYYANEGGIGLSTSQRGTGNVTANPRFRDRANGDLRLRDDSPLVDAGVTCSPGGVAMPDAAGNDRRAGRSVDIGAYELDADDPTGVVRLGTSRDETLSGTSGRDILCGYGGKDTLKGRAGSDYLDGGTSGDRLIGDTGSDRQYGGSGSDVICSRDGTRGNDYGNGGSGTDKGQRDSGDTQVSIEGSASC